MSGYTDQPQQLDRVIKRNECVGGMSQVGGHVNSKLAHESWQSISDAHHAIV